MTSGGSRSTQVNVLFTEHMSSQIKELSVQFLISKVGKVTPQLIRPTSLRWIVSDMVRKDWVKTCIWITLSAIRMFCRFCKPFSISSPCLPGQQGSCITTVELSENILQSLGNDLMADNVLLQLYGSITKFFMNLQNLEALFPSFTTTAVLSFFLSWMMRP